MIADTTTIRSELEHLQDLPTPVRSWLVEEGLDATDDPAVWVWALVESDDVDMDALSRLKDDGARGGSRRHRRSLGLRPCARCRRTRNRSVSLPRDLLAQARLLATKESSRPKQASLRHAISAAYYALFHLLVTDAV